MNCKLSFYVFSIILSVLNAQNLHNELELAMPNLPRDIRESSKDVTQFIKLWEFSIDKDNTGTGLLRASDPKTLLLPGDLSMVNLVPLDGLHPLYMEEPKYQKLRREFILDHLIQELVTTDSVKRGIEVETLSGKKVIMVQDPSGNILANNIAVHNVVSAKDGSQIYVLNDPLFDMKAKVREAFNEVHQINPFGPTGPPLDIPGAHSIRFPGQEDDVPRPPAPPPSDKPNIQNNPPSAPTSGISWPPAPPFGFQ